MSTDRRRDEDHAGLVLVLAGPTAVGKSDLALALASLTGAEIVSADSRQIYRFLDIGTAKPTIEERLRAPHHLVDIVAPDQEYTLASFQEDALQAIDGALCRGRLPLLVGGTGLYIRSVVAGLNIPRVAPDPELRASLERKAAEEGAEVLHASLAALDPQAATAIDARNVRRVIRAIEVCVTTGRPMSRLQTAAGPRHRFVTIGLTCPREVLYRRIDERIERQVAAGLVEETRRALDLGYDSALPSMSGLGHRQMALHVRGLITLDEAVQMDRHDTRRFARQQYNWFRLGDPAIRWLDVSTLQMADLVGEVERIVVAARPLSLRPAKGMSYAS